MSEFQYYEFQALDWPLDERQQAEVRALSSRATITATSFVNEYHWGYFRGDPDRLMELYYDAHLYVANWGTRRCMLRLPDGVLDPEGAARYCVGDQVMAWTSGENLILDVISEDDADDFVSGPDGVLAAIVGVRSEIASGDLRGLYLAWLAGVGSWERHEDVFDRAFDEEPEPPLPAGLGRLTAPQRALADFLRLDADLLDVAAEASPDRDAVTGGATALAAWVAKLPVNLKDELLTKVAQDEVASVRMQMLRHFRADSGAPVGEESERTVADLLDASARRHVERARVAAARRAEQDARAERERARARQRRLDELAGETDAAWARIEALIATRTPRGYDGAVVLLRDLHALAQRDGHLGVFADRCAEIRHRHARKSSLIERLDRARLVGPQSPA